jgi:hypothetical protein
MNLERFETILKMTQNQLKQYLFNELKQLGYKPIIKKGFLYAEGDTPVMLVAHMDTVHSQTPKMFLYSKDKRFVTSPYGIGGDDRSGIYMILEIAKSHKGHILFTEDEECGGVGASLFAKSNIKPDINYMIELDRKGSNDCVFYDDENTDFHKYINSFGFKTDYGSFSDISIIAPALGISAVNLSCGYYEAHTKHEYIDLKVMQTNIERVKNIISTKPPKFEYLSGFYGWYDDYIPQILMPISDGYIKLKDGELYDGYNYFIDSACNTYEYDFSNDICYPVEGQAFNENGIPLRFIESKSILIDTLIYF